MACVACIGMNSKSPPAFLDTPPASMADESPAYALDDLPLLRSDFSGGGRMALSERDWRRWFRAVSVQPRHTAELVNWIDGPLREFLQFERAFLAHGDVSGGCLQLTHWIATGHEAHYLRHLSATFEPWRRGTLAAWLAQRQPFFIDPGRPPDNASELELEEIQEFGLKNLGAHGVWNPRANAGTYFMFSGLRSPMAQWHLDALRVVAPVLNDLFLAHVPNDCRYSSPSLAKLTARQRDIVRHVNAGLTERDIAVVLDLSERVVHSQIVDICARLKVGTRRDLAALFR